MRRSVALVVVLVAIVGGSSGVFSQDAVKKEIINPWKCRINFSFLKGSR